MKRGIKFSKERAFEILVLFVSGIIMAAFEKYEATVLYVICLIYLIRVYQSEDNFDWAWACYKEENEAHLNSLRREGEIIRECHKRLDRMAVMLLEAKKEATDKKEA